MRAAVGAVDAGVPWHYLRPNHACRYPRRLVTFDTEARVQTTAKGEAHTFRLAAASFDRIDPATLTSARTELESFTTAEGLWEWVTGKAVKKERTVVFAHNLAYDMRVGRAFDVLPAMGWRLEFLTLDTTRCVARWSCGPYKLTLTDLMSYVPASLEVLAPGLGLAKVPLPAHNAADDRWLARCQADVQLTRAAVLELLPWLERNDMGSFRLTGAAQGMAAYRHRFMPRFSLLVHRDDEAIAAERAAAWSGRCELHRHGAVDEPVQEWDFELAYLRLARRLDLPVRFHGTVAKVSPGKLAVYARRYLVLCQATVSQDQPVLPCAVDGRTVWPVGTFTGHYWMNELGAAMDRGATVQVHRAWLYLGQPILRDWAEWLLAELAAPQADTPETVRRMLKGWSRSLIGRFGLRYPDWQHVATLPESSVEYTPFTDLDAGTEGAYLQVGHDWMEKLGVEEARDSMPAVMSYVMAEARVLLLTAMEAAGAGELLYVDTDALIVTKAGGRRIAAAVKRGELEGLRLKNAYSSATFSAPRSIRLGDTARVAGMPRSARQTGPETYTAQVWEGLGESLKHRHPGAVHVANRRYRLRSVDRRRQHLKGGATAPFVVQP